LKKKAHRTPEKKLGAEIALEEKKSSAHAKGRGRPGERKEKEFGTKTQYNKNMLYTNVTREKT